MRARAGLTGGHLCIDLTNIEMSAEDQQDLLRAVQTTVVAHLARQSAMSKVVTISMSPNNGRGPPGTGSVSPNPIGLPGPIRLPSLSRIRILLRLPDPDLRALGGAAEAPLKQTARLTLWIASGLITLWRYRGAVANDRAADLPQRDR